MHFNLPYFIISAIPATLAHNSYGKSSFTQFVTQFLSENIGSVFVVIMTDQRSAAWSTY